MKGDIFVAEAYALGKMLDHSGWVGKLPRGITPSDIDFYIDNDGRVIFGELSRQHTEWHHLSTGQQKGYRSMVENSNHCAVLCKHEVDATEGRKIDTVKDIVSFQVMFWWAGKFITPVFVGNAKWLYFVEQWMADSGDVLRRLSLTRAP